MATSYPGAIDNYTNPAAGDTTNNVTTPHATQHANHNDAIEAIETELGVDPAGAWTNVKTRLDVTVKNEWLNIESLGAVAGDAGQGTNNTNVINYAIGLTTAGGDIYIPPGTFYVDGLAGTDLLTVSPTQNGLNIKGIERSKSIIHDLRASGSTFAVKGTSSSVRAKYHEFSDFQVIGANGGTNSRKAFDFKWAGHITMERMQFWSTATAIYGLDWWDSLVNDCRFDQCSTRDGTATAAVVLLGQSSDSTDCNSLRFTNNTWEQCWERDVYLYSNGRDVNKIRFYSNKFECGGSGYLKGNRVYIVGGDSTTFLDNDFTMGEFYSGYTTPVIAISAVNTRALKVIGNRFEANPVSTGPTVDSFLAITDFGGTSDAIILVGNEFQASSNQTGIVGIEYALGAPRGDIVDYGNKWGYVASGTPAVRNGMDFRVPWTPHLDGATTDPGLGASAVKIGDYRITEEREVVGNGYLKWSGSGITAGAGTFSVTPPVAASQDLVVSGATSIICGDFTAVQAGGLTPGTHIVGRVHINAAGDFIFVPEVAGQVTTAYLNENAPWAWGTADDAIHFNFRYRLDN